MISFLNAVIDLPGNQIIIEVEILNPYQLGKLSGGKAIPLFGGIDVKAKDDKGNTFTVEIQVAAFDFFNKRILYYTSQSYVSQIAKGVQYDKLKPVYFIGILEFEIGKSINYFSRHKVLDVETKEQIIQDVEFNFIELPKFNKTIDQLETSIDQWIYFIKKAENLTLIPESVKDEGLKEAYTEANQKNWTKEELEDYERFSIKERDEKGRIEFAEKKGKREVAKAMKLKGYSTDTISELTNLSDVDTKVCKLKNLQPYNLNIPVTSQCLSTSMYLQCNFTLMNNFFIRYIVFNSLHII